MLHKTLTDKINLQMDVPGRLRSQTVSDSNRLARKRQSQSDLAYLHLGNQTYSLYQRQGQDPREMTMAMSPSTSIEINPSPLTWRPVDHATAIPQPPGYVRLDPKHPNPPGRGSQGLFEWTKPHPMEIVRMKDAVTLVTSPNGNPQKTEERIRRSVASWRSLKHPNVTEFFDVVQMEPNRPHGLFSRQMAHEITPSLLHPQRRDPPVIHGDIDNVLICDNGPSQLNDFAILQILDVQGFITKVYTAPELLPVEETPGDLRSSMKSDVFNLNISSRKRPRRDVDWGYNDAGASGSSKRYRSVSSAVRLASADSLHTPTIGTTGSNAADTRHPKIHIYHPGLAPQNRSKFC
ncbi:hypothetical protein FIBSPDRAFT_846870 [Athelia psychrophila]|uniref:Protein kinase domain-containing protein n=1 Tax=Athelia psychrophila TaxID=1759441 RepID=A0A166WFV5_9AGAM|nr:hypothetical protein FIBSPDRAFT_846870 [Fibularhizoctonia sp. CBS 109695]